MPPDESGYPYCPLQETHVIIGEHRCANSHNGKTINCPIHSNHDRCPLNNGNETEPSNAPLLPAAQAA